MGLHKLLKEKATALKKNNHREAAILCNTIGEEYRKRREYDAAIHQHKEELAMCKLVNDNLGKNMNRN